MAAIQGRPAPASAPGDELYRLIAELTSDCLYVLRVLPSGEVEHEWSNDAFARVTRYTTDEVGEPGAWQRLVHPDDVPAASEHLAALTAGQRHQAEYRIVTKDGQHRWLRDTGEPLRDRPDGPIVRILGAAQDISERRAAEQAQRELMALIGHELRNPLASLRGYAQLLQRRQSYNEGAVQVIVQQVDRLNRLIGDLVDASRLERGRLELERAPTDLVAAVAAAIASAAQLSGEHTIRLEPPRHMLPLGHWDSDRIGQVLQNLIGNAVKYTPAGELVVRIDDDGGAARVSVIDRGSGIAPREMPRLFGRFYRAEGAALSDAGGLGLGLYICRGLVESHGGRIWVEGTPGGGATFTFTLPYASTTGD